MNRSEDEIKRLTAWRKNKNLTLESGAQNVRKFTAEQPETPNFHFFCFDPSLGAPDLGNVSLKRDDNSDKAIFSIPVDYTENTKTKYAQHDNSEFGFDVRFYLTRNNAPTYPIRK